MDFIRDDIRTLYFKFLLPSMASAIVMSVCSFVDAIAVGQSEGATGTAAMAVIAPVYGVIVFLALLCGIGGSVMMSMAKGEGQEEKGNACFTVSVLCMSIFTILAWIVFLLFREQIFALFGANAEIMPKTVEYGRWIVWFLPVFIFPIFIGAFIRNDGAPKLAMAAVLTGGCVNIFGDWFFVFPLGMGMTGAAIATVIGTSVQALIMFSHFFRKSCGLKLVMPHHVLRGFRRLLQIGIGASVLELGSVVIGMLMNNQILKYGGTVELAVYGAIATIMSLFQALFGGVGQAIQPLVSSNFGAKKPGRIKKVWSLSILTVIGFGITFTLLGEFFPLQITRLFIKATPEVLAAAPEIFRLYFPVFLFLGITVLADYYLQSVMEEKMSVVIGLMHSVVASSILILSLPIFWKMRGVWLAMPIAELITAATGLYYVVKKVNPGFILNSTTRSF